MKTGISLQELASIVTRNNETKQDFLVPTSKMEITPDGRIEISGHDSFPLTEHAHSQLATYTKIPKPYYDLIRTEAPDLYAANVNRWLNREPTRMIRTLDGKARAIMSEKYRPLDNYDLLTAVLPVLGEMRVELKSTQITENKMYLKVLLPELRGHVSNPKLPNDEIHGGFTLSNSEVGTGSLAFEEFWWRLVCTNGMIGEYSMRKYHVGGSKGFNLESVSDLWTDKTRKISDAAFWNQLQDTMRGVTSKDHFQAALNRMSETTGNMITGSVERSVEVLTNTFRFTEDQRNDVMKHLITGGDLSQWGLANAVTRTAEDQDSYDVATELERIGGKIINLKGHEWSRIAAAV